MWYKYKVGLRMAGVISVGGLVWYCGGEEYFKCGAMYEVGLRMVGVVSVGVIYCGRYNFG